MRLFLAVMVTVLFCQQHGALAQEQCYNDLPEVLSCFIKEEDPSFGYVLQNTHKGNHGLIIKEYILSSQTWPLHYDQNIPSTVWQHRLKIYIPPHIMHKQALLHVGAGYNVAKDGKAEFFDPVEYLAYEKIALDNQAVVVALEDVPNQYLFFNGEPHKEDQIMAYTYTKVMENEMQHAYLAGHLPMAKSVVKAMDAVGMIMQKDGIVIDDYVLVGASKRGWAVWLTALADARVKAIIPIVIDIFNVYKTIDHICGVYKNGCPPAMQDYKKLNITEKIESPAFINLMKIEDPLSYLGDGYDPIYRQRLAIPKYIINASGDDFFVPDASQFYFNLLPGQHNYIRYLPNAMHYLMGNPISDAIGKATALNEAVNHYFNFILHGAQLPKVKWDLTPDYISINSDICPQEMRLWVAHNSEERDFRYIQSYDKWHLFKKKALSYFMDDFGDTYYQQQKVDFTCQAGHSINVALPKHNSGWQASFVEIDYDINGYEFIVSTEVQVSAAE